MNKTLKFPYSFSGFSQVDLVNSFSTVHMYMEQMKGSDLVKMQEELFFLFGTITGRNSLRNSFKGNNQMQKQLDDTDEVMSILMDYCGYSYSIIKSNIKEAIIKAIDNNTPVLARMKQIHRGSFRVIIGYDTDEDKVICPNYSNAQNKPLHSPTINEIEKVYIIQSKTEKLKSLDKCFEQIHEVMTFNEENNIWDEFIDEFNYYDKLKQCNIKEIKSKFSRVSDTMWYTFNCHNFAETVDYLSKNTSNEQLKACYKKIREYYSSTHDLCWQLIAINASRDWSSKLYDQLEWGMCNTVIMILKKIKHNDELVHEMINECMKLC